MGTGAGLEMVGPGLHSVLKCPDSPFVHVAISRASSLIQQVDSIQAAGGEGSMGRSADDTHHCAYNINAREAEHGLARCLQESSVVFCLKEEVENRLVKYSVAQYATWVRNAGSGVSLPGFPPGSATCQLGFSGPVSPCLALVSYKTWMTMPEHCFVSSEMK